MKRKRATTKAIWIEWREPETPHESKLYGRTRYDNAYTARVFINSLMNKSAAEQAKTFWHELVHVFVNFYNTDIRPDKEERLCYALERVIWEIINV